MNKRYLLPLAVLLVATLAFAQSSIGPYLQPRSQTESAFVIPDSGYVTGAIAYGTDAGTLYYSNGFSWFPVSYTAFDAYNGGHSLAGIVVQQTRTQVGGAVRRLTATSVVAGTGAANATVELYNVTTAAVLCTVTFACTAAAGTVTAADCTTGFKRLDDVAIRVTTDGCANSPHFNVSAWLQ